jgi:hypothetical protein
MINAEDLLNQFSSKAWDAEQEHDDKTVESQVEREPVMPTTSDAIGAIKTLHHYFGGLESTKNEDFEKIISIEATILTVAVSKQKQINFVYKLHVTPSSMMT